MKPSTVLTGLAMLVGGLALPGVAAAQQLPFESIAGGPIGPFGPAQQLVIDSDQDLIGSGVHGLLDPGAEKPDFAAGDVAIAVFMGTRSSGGYGIEVVRIERQQLATIQPVPTPPPAYELVVEFRTSEPPPGAMVTMALTAPFHVVKLRPGSYATVRFVDVGAGSGGSPGPAPAPEVTTVDRAVSHLGQATRIRVADDGAVEVERRSGAASSLTVAGTATPLERAELRQALAGADVGALPGRLPDPVPAQAEASSLRYQLERKGVPDVEVRGTAGSYGPFAARLDPLDAALDAILRRILDAAQPSPRSFERLVLHTNTPGALGDAYPLTRDVRVEASGEVEVLQSHPLARFAPVRGTATPAELAALRLAVERGALGSIPSPLPVRLPPDGPLAPFRLTVIDAGRDATVEGPHLGPDHAWDARLRPTVEALRALGERVLAAAGRDVFQGEVLDRLSGLALRGVGRTVRIANPVDVAALRRFHGLEVTVAGALTERGPRRGVMVVDEIVNPRPVGEVVGNVAERQGEPVLLVGDASALREVRLHGPAKRVLALAVGQRVKIQAWLFLDADGAPREAYVESVAATVSRTSFLTRAGFATGLARAGETVAVTQLSMRGDAALVRARFGNGYLPVARLELGTAAPAGSATPSGAPTPGLVGALEATPSAPPAGEGK